MKRKIKFRGVDKTGKLHYGYFYVDFCGLPCIAEGRGGKLIPVDENSVAQLIGVDKNGFEVYEGDLVIRIAGDEDFNPEKTFHMAATFEDFSAIRDEEIVLEEGLIKIRDRSRN